MPRTCRGATLAWGVLLAFDGASFGRSRPVPPWGQLRTSSGIWPIPSGLVSARAPSVAPLSHHIIPLTIRALGLSTLSIGPGTNVKNELKSEIAQYSCAWTAASQRDAQSRASPTEIPRRRSAFEG